MGSLYNNRNVNAMLRDFMKREHGWVYDYRSKKFRQTKPAIKKIIRQRRGRLPALASAIQKWARPTFESNVSYSKRHTDKGIPTEVYSFNYKNNLKVNSQSDRVSPEILRLSKIVRRTKDNEKVKILLFDNDKKHYGTKFLDDVSDVVKEILDKIRDNLAKYQIPPFLMEVYKIEFIYATFNDAIAGKGSSRSIARMFMDFNELSDKTRTNCLFTAYIRAERQDKDVDINIDNPSKQLKKIVNPNNKEYSDMETVKELSDYKKRDIIVYDNQGEKIHHIKPEKYKTRKKESPIELRIKSGHWSALVRRTKAEKEELSNKKKEELPKNETTPAYDGVKIQRNNKNFNSHFRDTKYATWDLETVNIDGVVHPYACGLCWKSLELDILVSRQWWGLDTCIDEFIDFLNGNISMFRNYVFYAHNGGKFDTNLLLERVLKDNSANVRGNTELNGRWLNVTVKFNHKYQIHFRDSWTLVSDSLANACKSFKVKHQKLVETVNHDDINCFNYEIHKPEVSKYLDNDVKGLYEIVELLSKCIWDATVRNWTTKDGRAGKTGVNITGSYTNAGIAKKAYFNNDYNPNRFPIYKLNKDTDRFIRKSYLGGRVESFVLRKLPKVNYMYDFTSLYPSEMVYDLPYGLPIHRSKEQINPETFHGFIRCMVRQKMSCNRGSGLPYTHLVNLHGVKGHNGLTFPTIINWTEMYLYSHELQVGLKHDLYEYDIIDGIEFRKGTVMKSFIEKMYKLKQEAEKDGNKVMRKTAKIIINSSYGFWGLRTEGRDGVEIVDSIGDQKCIDAWNENRMISIGKIGNKVVMRCEKELDVQEVNVSIASAITSRSRCRLWSLICDIKKNKGCVYYCDTDSVITNCKIENNEDLMSEYMWDGDGSELGSLKNEAIDMKVYKHYEVNDSHWSLDGWTNYEDSFNGGFVSGKKNYCLTMPNGEMKASCKGYSFRTIDDKKYIVNDGQYKELEMLDFENDNIQGDQLRMNCGKADFVSETHPFQIRQGKVIKKITTKYNAGN